MSYPTAVANLLRSVALQLAEQLLSIGPWKVMTVLVVVPLAGTRCFRKLSHDFKLILRNTQMTVGGGPGLKDASAIRVAGLK